jgi:predicted O-linked N-acetylglucosamine transferase (SPINDLY family)
VVPPELATPDATRVEYLFGQSAFKILPIHDQMLARIARGLPAARFHFMPHPLAHTRRQLRDRITRHFAREGLDFDAHAGLFRFVKEAEYLGVASRVAVNLDSLGWSGGNTTLEVLWFNTPTVTLPGALMRGRHTYAMLKRLELDELIARDLDDYVRIAVELGRSPDWRAELSARIAERKHRLYDDTEVITALTRFLREHAAPAANP